MISRTISYSGWSFSSGTLRPRSGSLLNPAASNRSLSTRSSETISVSCSSASSVHTTRGISGWSAAAAPLSHSTDNFRVRRCATGFMACKPRFNNINNALTLDLFKRALDLRKCFCIDYDCGGTTMMTDDNGAVFEIVNNLRCIALKISNRHLLNHVCLTIMHIAYLNTRLDAWQKQAGGSAMLRRPKWTTH